VRKFLFWVIVAALAFVGKGYWNATRDPLVREATVKLANWPVGTPPVRVLLVSDIHVAGPDMPPERVRAIAAKLNMLKPDLILIAGDLVSEKRLATHIYRTDEVVSSLGVFRAPLGVVAVMGNHDHWFDESGFQSALPKAGLTLLSNEAIKRGPLVIGGVDDDFSDHADIAKTFAVMDKLEGPRLILTHSPDIIPTLPSRVAAVLAGHTHCGQMVFPLIGAVGDVSRYGPRFRCGQIVDKGQPVFVTAGLGTSVLWLRYGAPPDVWLVTLGP
jgi:uncharacterized protein